MYIIIALTYMWTKYIFEGKVHGRSTPIDSKCVAPPSNSTFVWERIGVVLEKLQT